MTDKDAFTKIVLDTAAALSKMLDGLDGVPTQPPSLYFDLEGERLSRHGSISILQLHVLPSKRTYLVDVHTLQHTAFSTCGENGRTLKEILECDGIPKVFFDVRNDSDALYSHFNISLAGVQDLQLMELATRTFSKRCVNGLSRCGLLEPFLALATAGMTGYNSRSANGVSTGELLWLKLEMAPQISPFVSTLPRTHSVFHLAGLTRNGNYSIPRLTHFLHPPLSSSLSFSRS